MAEKKKSEASGTMEYLLEYICDERYAASKADGTQEALNDTCDGCECGARARRLAEPVAEALKEFCRQEDEFAQAVVQGGPFADCMKAVSKGAGSVLSDWEAYRRAVRFYFPKSGSRCGWTWWGTLPPIPAGGNGLPVCF